MSSTAVSALAGKRVLVVEDEYFIATEIAEALEAAGAVVIGPAATVPEAEDLAAASEGRLDAALLDVNLGGTMIWPVLELLTAREVPVVLSTGYEEGSIPPAYAHLSRHQKPVSMRVLLRALAERIQTEA